MDGARLLASYRRTRKLSQSAMARILGVHRGLVSRWEKRERRPDGDNRDGIDRVTRGAVPAKAWLRNGTPKD